jgi:hypothetical protein
MLHRYISVHPQLRELNGSSFSIEQFRNVCKVSLIILFFRLWIIENFYYLVKECRELVVNSSETEYNDSWYTRYKNSKYSEEISQSCANGLINKDKLVDCKTSFIHSDYNNATDNPWEDEETDNNFGIFDCLFNASDT